MGQKKNTYYNVDRKNKFLWDSTCKKDANGNLVLDENGQHVVERKSIYTVTRSLLNKIGVFESQYGKDFCEIQNGKDDAFLSDIYNKWLSQLSQDASKRYHIILWDYLEWCRNENIITTAEYYNHPFFGKRVSGWKSKTGDGFRSIRTTNQIKYLESDDSNEGLKENYIFKSEDEFFDYIDELFGVPEYIMSAAICCLLYYGFDMEEIRLIKREEVDDDARTVRGVVIENKTAFELICKAKHASVFVVSQDRFELKKEYWDGPYLIRSCISKTGKKPIPDTYCKKVRHRENKAAENLSIKSKHKNIRIKVSSINKLRDFYSARNDEKQYGSDTVLNNFRNQKYGSLKYREYQIMCLKADKEDK